MISIIAQESDTLSLGQNRFFKAKNIEIKQSSGGGWTLGKVEKINAQTAPKLAIGHGPSDYQVNGTADFNSGNHTLFTNTPTSDAVRTMALHTRATGTMTFCPTIITSEFARFVEALEAVKQIPAEERETLGIVGVHIEGRWIDYNKRGIHDPNYLAPEMTQNELDTLCGYGKEGILKMVTISPNIVTPAQIQQLVAAGIVISIGHSTATSEKVLEAMVAGAQHATHLGNASAGSIEPRDEKSGILNIAFMASGLIPGIPRLVSGLICDDGVHIHDNYFQNALHAHGAYDQSMRDIRINITADNATSPCSQDFSFNFGPGGRMVNYSHAENTCREQDSGTLGGAATTMQTGIDRLLRLGVPKKNALHIASGVTRKLLKVKPGAGTLDHQVLYDRETLQIVGYFQGKTLVILDGQSLNSYAE